MDKKAETPRTRNREWGFYGTCVTNGHQDPEAAWDEAMAALTDPKGRFRLEAEDARDLLDATCGRHLADQVVGQERFHCPTMRRTPYLTITIFQLRTEPAASRRAT